MNVFGPVKDKTSGLFVTFMPRYFVGDTGDS